MPQQNVINEHERVNLAQKFGWRCWYCGVKLYAGGGHIDHIVPRGRGGPDIESNRALTCNFCNMAKFDYPLDEFMSWLEWVRSGKSFTPYNMDAEAIKQAIRNELGDQNWNPQESGPPKILGHYSRQERATATIFPSLRLRMERGRAWLRTALMRKFR